MKQLSGAKIFLDCLKREKVDTIFGFPGGAVLNLYDELYHSDIRHYLVRHEQAAVHAADGYARATGDLDIMLSFESENLDKFVGWVKRLGLRPRIPVDVEELKEPRKIEIWKAEKHMKVFSIYNPDNEMEQIDVMIDHDVDFESAYRNRDTFWAKGISIPVISIDDLIALKKKASRKRDHLDIEALLRIKEIKHGA